MSELSFDPFGGSAPAGDDDAITFVDPTRSRVEERVRWEARSAQWRARHLAEVIFGGAVEARLTGHGVRRAFRGLLHLDVPFRGLEDHREREGAFLAAARRDPLLARIPFVFVFGPRLAS